MALIPCDLKASCQQTDHLSQHLPLIFLISSMRRKLSEDADKNIGFRLIQEEEIHRKLEAINI